MNSFHSDPVMESFDVFYVTWTNSFILDALGLLFAKHELTLIPALMSNWMPGKMWDEIIYPFSNFNSFTVEVWEWISNFTTLNNGCDYLSMLVKGHLVPICLHCDEMLNSQKTVNNSLSQVSFGVYIVSYGNGFSHICCYLIWRRNVTTIGVCYIKIR